MPSSVEAANDVVVEVFVGEKTRGCSTRGVTPAEEPFTQQARVRLGSFDRFADFFGKTFSLFEVSFNLGTVAEVECDDGVDVGQAD